MLQTPRKPWKKCCNCGKPVYSNKSKYCCRCAFFAFRLNTKAISTKAKKALWAYVRKYYFRCYYTGMLLEMVITSNLVNEMKSDLTEAEFRDIISRLAAHRSTGAPVNKHKLKYWSRPYGR